MSQVTQITSSTNLQFRTWKSLSTSKGIKEHKMFFLMGKKLVQEFLENPVKEFTPHYLVTTELQPQKSTVRQTILSKDLFTELDVLGTKSPLLLLSFEEIPPMNWREEPLGLELVTPLGDPRNLGALTRTALGFGVHSIILTQESAHPFLPEAIKASAGAALRMKYKRSPEPLNEIPALQGNFALALHGEDIRKIKWPRNLRLWVGEEGPGLQLDLSQKKNMRFVNIPTTEVESLNAMVSTSIAIWEWKKQNV